MPGPVDRPDLRRAETDLAFSIGTEHRPLTFRKAALVDIGTAVRDGSLCRTEVGWRASTFAPLFPVFAGQLVADGRQLELRGIYEPPGGGIGLLIDQALLQYFARRTGRWFLDRIADAATGRAPRIRHGLTTPAVGRSPALSSCFERRSKTAARAVRPLTSRGARRA